jgi:hypothetical protein
MDVLRTGGFYPLYQNVQNCALDATAPIGADFVKKNFPGEVIFVSTAHGEVTGAADHRLRPIPIEYGGKPTWVPLSSSLLAGRTAT